MTFKQPALRGQQIKWSMFRILVLILCAGLFVACGVKTPPVPPRHKTLPTVQNLSYSIDAETVALTWSLPDANEKEKGGSEVSYFQVYRSKVKLSEPECETCPITFRKIAEVSAKPRNIKERLKKMRPTYAEPLQHGYRYIYKVTAHADNGVSGGSSNLVKFSY